MAAQLLDMERHTQGLVRAVAAAGGDPIPPDLRAALLERRRVGRKATPGAVSDPALIPIVQTGVHLWGRGAAGEAMTEQHIDRLTEQQRARCAHAAARQRSQAANAASRPYWMYSSRQDSLADPAHAAFNEVVFRADDPIWNTHYPPNGWNCRCRVRALTESQVRSEGLRVHDSRRDGELRQVVQEAGIDKHTGEVDKRLGTAYTWTDAAGQTHTLLPDPGWSYNPGRSGQGLPDIALTAQPALKRRQPAPQQR